MKCVWVMVCGLALTATTALAITVTPPKAETGEVAKSDGELFKGSWTILKAERSTGVDENLKGLQYHFDGKKVVMETPSYTAEPVPMTFAYALDPDAKPKRLTMTIHGETGQKMQIKGIYELDGDTLRICYYWGTGRTKEPPPPTKFAVDPKNPASSVVELKRVPSEP